MMDPNPIQPPTRQQPVVPTPPPKKNSGILIGILLLFLGILVGLTIDKTTLLSNIHIPYLGVAPTPTPFPTPTPTPDPTANWKTYTNSDLAFKYPASWTVSANNITSNSPQIRINIIPKTSTLMNECMKEASTDTRDTIVIKKFERVVTGAMCETADSTPREIWVASSGDKFLGGISYQYSSLESQQAETIFNHILSTFRFTESSQQPISGTKLGYIKAISQNNNQYVFDVDFIDAIDGDPVIITNKSTETTSLPFSKTSTITLVTYEHGVDGNFVSSKLSIDEFLPIFNSSVLVKTRPYQLQITNGQITAITEQYLP